MIAYKNSIAQVLGRNLVILVAGAVVVTATVIGASTYFSSQQTINQESKVRLATMASVQAASIESYAKNLSQVMVAASELPEIISAAKIMVEEFPKLKTKADLATQRKSVAGYYSEQFGKEFAKRNAGANVQGEKLAAEASDETIASQYLYISANENPLGKKNLLDEADDGSEYSKTHGKVHKTFKSLYDKFGFYDFFIVNPTNGSIVYTYFKEIDYGTSLINGPFSKTPLGEAFRTGLKQKAGSPWVSSFAPYKPSYNDQAAFMSVPIYDRDVLVAVMIIQMPIDKINQVMTLDGKWEERGLGRTGQTLLIDNEGMYLSIGREVAVDPARYVASLTGTENEKLANQIKIAGSDVGLIKLPEALMTTISGTPTGSDIFDLPGGKRLVAFAPSKLLNQDFKVVAQIEAAEAFEPLGDLLGRVLIIGVLSAAVLGAVALAMSRSLVQKVTVPLARVTKTVGQLNEGNFDARVGIKSEDEFGELSSALDNLLDDRLKTLTESAKQTEQLNNSVIEIMQAIGTIATTKDLGLKMPVAEDLTGAISDALNLLTDETSKVLRAVGLVSKDVAQATLAVRTQSESATKAAVREQAEVESAASELATAAESLSSVARQALQANEVAERAVKTTNEAMRIVGGTVIGIAESRDLIRETEKRIKRLGERSQEIGQVVNIIQGIAERTGILALNASMHAAAAGEAGRSFAVVADEVKRLSESARDSTSQIGRLVSSIQSETKDTVIAMNQAIGQVVEISKMADDAGREMKRTQDDTQELAASVRDIAKSSVEQARVSSGLQERARVIKESSAETARQLNSQSSETKRLVDYAKALLQEVSVFKVPD
jgi:methyl-accepting chemotaxis protein